MRAGRVFGDLAELYIRLSAGTSRHCSPSGQGFVPDEHEYEVSDLFWLDQDLGRRESDHFDLFGCDRLQSVFYGFRFDPSGHGYRAANSGSRACNQRRSGTHATSDGSVFPPQIRAPTRSLDSGLYAPERSAASAVAPPGSAMSRVESHSAR